MVTLPWNEYNLLKFLYDQQDDKSFLGNWNFSDYIHQNPCVEPWDFLQIISNDTWDHCYLEEFQIRDFHLQGTLPQYIENLMHLKTLLISGTFLSGNLPRFRNMPALKVILLSHSLFSGSIPNDMLEDNIIPQITFFGVNNNLLMGILPSWVFQMKELQILQLHDNHLSGTIPSSFVNLNKLNTLLLNNNQFYGSFSFHLTNFTNLCVLSLASNFFTGEVFSLSSLTSLTVNTFDIEGNNFHGKIPTIFQTSVYNIGSNFLSGTLPLSLCSPKNKIRLLNVRDNVLSGTLPNCLFTSSSSPPVQFYDFNNFHGNLELLGEIPKDLSNPRTLTISHNYFSGLFPIELLSWKTSLRVFTASGNCFRGGFHAPNHSSINYAMKYLELDSLFTPHKCFSHFASRIRNVSILMRPFEAFGGPFPEFLFQQFPSLSGLSMVGNKFTGSLSVHTSLPQDLKVLNLSHNLLTGEIPIGIQKISLELLDVSWNKFRSEIKGFTNSQSINVYNTINLENNRLSGKLAPLSSLNISNLQILEGNIYDCRDGKRLLKLHNLEKYYFCESSRLDNSSLISLIILVIVFIVGFRLFLLEKRKFNISMKQILKNLVCSMKQVRTDSLALETTILIRRIISNFLVGILFLFICWATFIYLHSNDENNVYEKIYGWNKTSLYLKGRKSALCLMTLLITLLFLYTWTIASSNAKRSDPLPENQALFRSSQDRPRSLRYTSTWEFNAFVKGLYIIIFLLNLIISITISSFYIQLIHYPTQSKVINDHERNYDLSGSIEVLFVQIAFAFFHLVWNRVLLVLLCRYLYFLSSDVVSSKWWYHYGVMLSLVNNIMGPFIATMVYNDSCLAPLWIFNRQELKLVDHSICRFFERHSLISYCFEGHITRVPFIYYFNCSQEHMKLFLPVWIIYYSLHLLIQILFYLLFFDIIRKSSNLVLKNFVMIHNFHNENVRNRRERKVESSINILWYEIFRFWENDMTILLCYGIHYPSGLGLIICISMMIESIKWIWLNRKYSKKYEEKEGISETKKDQSRLEEDQTPLIKVEGTDHTQSNGNVDSLNKVEEGIELLFYSQNNQSPGTPVIRKKSISREISDDLPQLLPENSFTEKIPKRGMKRVNSFVQVVSITIIFHFVIFLDIIGEKDGIYTGILFSFVVIAIIFAISIFFNRLCLFILETRNNDSIS